MATLIIRRDPEHILDTELVALRDFLKKMLEEMLDPSDAFTEIRVQEVGKFDLNCPPLAIDFIAGRPLRNNEPIKHFGTLTMALNARLIQSGLLKKEWIGAKRSYIRFNPAQNTLLIGYPERQSC